MYNINIYLYINQGHNIFFFLGRSDNWTRRLLKAFIIVKLQGIKHWICICDIVSWFSFHMNGITIFTVAQVEKKLFHSISIFPPIN